MKASPVTIVSTDSEAEIQAALGKAPAAKETKTEAKPALESAASEEPAETKDASETSKPEEKEAKNGEETPPEQRPKKKNGFKKRIDKLNLRNSELQNEAEYWKAKATAKAEPENKVETKKADIAGKPKEDQFETHAEYVEALTDWKVDQKDAKRAADSKQAEIKTAYDNQLKSYQERRKEFEKTHEDFKDVLSEVDDVRMSLTVQGAILESENGPELAYELAKNPEEFKRICALSPEQANRAIGRFEAKLKSQSSEELKTETKTTKAPLPIKPIGSKAGHVKTLSDEMPYEEWVKMRRDQLKGA